MLVCKKAKACFFLSTLVLGLSASNISCSANTVNKGLIKQAQKKSFSNTKSKSNSEVKWTLNNFLNKIKVLAIEKPEAILLPAGIFLAALFTATFVYHVRKKNLQELPNNSNAEEEKSTDVTQNFEPDGGKENDSGATKKTNEKDDADRKGDVSQDEKASIKGTPTKTNLEKDDNSKTCEKDVNTSKEKTINEETSPEKAFYNDIMRYTKVAKWWCFWSVLLFAWGRALGAIVGEMLGMCTSKIGGCIFGLLAPFLTFCLDPILTALKIPHSLRVFLEAAIFSSVAVFFTALLSFGSLRFIIDNVRLAMKGKKMLNVWEAQSYYKKLGGFQRADIDDFWIYLWACNYKQECIKRYFEIYEALNT